MLGLILLNRSSFKYRITSFRRAFRIIPIFFSLSCWEVWRKLEGIVCRCSRSSRPKVFCKKGIVRNFGKFTGKHLCQNVFLNKVADLRPATLLKERLWHRCFSVNFAKFLRTPFLTERLRWLLLVFYRIDVMKNSQKSVVVRVPVLQKKTPACVFSD